MCVTRPDTKYIRIQKCLTLYSYSQGYFQPKIGRKVKPWPNGLFSISLANNRLTDVTQLALTWVVWPNGEKLALTRVQI